MSEISKAFILGAGLGSRLRPLTDTLPKPLVPLFHEPLASHTMRHCLEAGIECFAINTHHIPAAWQQTYPESSFEGAPITFFHEPILLETGGGIKNIAPFIGDDPVLVYNGDILTDLDLTQLMAAHRGSGNVATLALFSEGPNCNVAVEDHQVVDLRHAHGIHPGTHQFTGIYIIEPEILPLIPANEKISIVPAFLELAALGKLGAYIADGASWHDLGTREEYFAAHQHLQDSGKATLPAIHPQAKIDPSAELDEYTIIGPNCVIEKNVKLRKTIAWPRATISENSNLYGCIVREQAAGEHQDQDL
ncbi:UTP--glucose-1-phosphate uridylyltransferase [Rubritalea halochordaticola]|uniref:UTP--glucose-1-phosphate uridylyltransferase n=1 Tax=Rubritalea halochordaticola TaxID=714537 RepID=A0ABP9UZH1_9BACT